MMSRLALENSLRWEGGVVFVCSQKPTVVIFGSFWCFLVLFDSFWFFLVFFCFFLILFGSFLVLFGAFWFFLVLFVSFWWGKKKIEKI